MRIIGGKYKGLKLLPPDGNKIRPTSDRLKESLFSIITSKRYQINIDNCNVYYDNYQSKIVLPSFEELSRLSGSTGFTPFQNKQNKSFISHGPLLLSFLEFKAAYQIMFIHTKAYFR